MSRSKATETAVRALARHPYLSLFAMIMALTPLSFGHMAFVNNAAWIFTLAVFGLITAGCVFLTKRLGWRRLYTLSIGISAALLWVTLLALYSLAQRKTVWHLAGGMAGVFLLWLAADRKKYRTQINSLLIMGLGFFLKFYYVLSTSMFTRQNDVGRFEAEHGHASYIMYLYTHWSLPDFSPETRWQYAHPPLHHFICAVWLRFSRDILHTGDDPARESIQMLTLFYSMCIMVTAYLILRHFRLKGAALCIPLIIINFHPAFVLLSGSVNNDVLSVAFITGAILLTLRWQKKPETKTIVKLALCIGCGMMTKISAALVAPPVAVVFLMVLIKNRKDGLWKLINQFTCFGLICIPLGMWFPVYELARWRIPFTFVYRMPNDSYQYVGNIPFSDRVTDFSLSQLSPIYEHWRGADKFGNLYGDSEFNPLIALLKNSVFGESFGSTTFEKYPFIYGLLPVFFWINVLLAAAGFAALVLYTIRKGRANGRERTFLACFYLLTMASFYKTSADYPFTCTMNFRYITPTAILGSVYIGFALSETLKTPKGKKLTRPRRALVNTFGAAAAAFALCSVTVYMFLCIDS